jgi:nitrite reductase/ring-hydroxylating ferredoxin subunit
LKTLVPLCKLTDLPRGKAKLVKLEKRRLACVREGNQVQVLDDRCPHQGHALSMGPIEGGVLTCPWHNWKFDVATGACLRGGESVRHYDSEVLDGIVYVHLQEDNDSAIERHDRDILRALVQGDTATLVRELLRLANVASERFAWQTLLARVTEFEPHNDDALHVWAGFSSLLGLRSRAWLDVPQTFALAGAAAVEVTAHARHLPLNHKVSIQPPRIHFTASDDARWTDDENEEKPEAPGTATAKRALLEAMLEGDAQYAEKCLHNALTLVPAAALLRLWLLPYLSVKLWDDGKTLAQFGALLGFLRSPLLADAPELAARILACHVRVWSRAVATSDLPNRRALRQSLLGQSLVGQFMTEAAPPVVSTAPKRYDWELAIRQLATEGERETVLTVTRALQDSASFMECLRGLREAWLTLPAEYDSAWSSSIRGNGSAWDVVLVWLAGNACEFYVNKAKSNSEQACARLLLIAMSSVVGRLARRRIHDPEERKKRHDLVQLAQEEAMPAREQAMEALKAVLVPDLLRPRVAWASYGRLAAWADTLAQHVEHDSKTGAAAIAAWRRTVHVEPGIDIERLARAAERTVARENG